MLPEIFVEERKVVEAQGECNFLDRHIGRFKLRFGIHNDDIAQDIQCSPSADLFYHITEMLQGDGLTSFLGVGREMQVDINVRGIPLHSGDRILMTTDGLYKLVSDEEINRILTNFKNIGEAVQALEMKAAHGALKKRTVRDNMTIALVNIK